MSDNRVPFTDAVIRNAVMPEGSSSYFLYDTTQPGLALRMRASGAKTFVFIFSTPSKRGSQRYTIGDARKVPVKDAQRATLGALLASEGLYEKALTSRKLVNIRPALSTLRRQLLPGRSSIDVRHLTLLDITNAMDALVADGKKGAAHDLRKHASGFLVWAKSKGFIENNPLAGYRRPKKTRAEREEIETKAALSPTTRSRRSGMLAATSAPSVSWRGLASSAVRGVANQRL